MGFMIRLVAACCVRTSVVIAVLSSSVVLVGGELADASAGRAAVTDGVGVRAEPAGAITGVPINHVIIVYQENHSFDNVLGALCVYILQGKLYVTVEGHKERDLQRDPRRTREQAPVLYRLVDTGDIVHIVDVQTDVPGKPSTNTLVREACSLCRCSWAVN